MLGYSVKVIVLGSSSNPRSNGCPQDEQKFEPAKLRCPQLLQKTSANRVHLVPGSYRSYRDLSAQPSVSAR